MRQHISQFRAFIPDFLLLETFSILSSFGMNVVAYSSVMYDIELMPTRIRAQGVGIVRLVGYSSTIFSTAIVYLVSAAVYIGILRLVNAFCLLPREIMRQSFRHYCWAVLFWAARLWRCFYPKRSTAIRRALWPKLKLVTRTIMCAHFSVAGSPEAGRVMTIRKRKLVIGDYRQLLILDILVGELNGTYVREECIQYTISYFKKKPPQGGMSRVIVYFSIYKTPINGFLGKIGKS